MDVAVGRSVEILETEMEGGSVAYRHSVNVLLSNRDHSLGLLL